MSARIVAASLLALVAACSSKKPAGNDPPPPSRDAAPAAPDAHVDPTTITIENRLDAPIWVTSASTCRRYPLAITAPDGAPVQLDGQAIDCATARQGNCPTVGGCQGAGVWRLEPGTSFDVTWDGVGLTARTLAAGEAAAGCPSACVDRATVPDGTYTLIATAWSACTGDDCACPDAPCARPAGLTGQPDLTAKAPLIVPGTAGMRVLFQ